jgi:hypothetical protein
VVLTHRTSLLGPFQDTFRLLYKGSEHMNARSKLLLGREAWVLPTSQSEAEMGPFAGTNLQCAILLSPSTLPFSCPFCPKAHVLEGYQ